MLSRTNSLALVSVALALQPLAGCGLPTPAGAAAAATTQAPPSADASASDHATPPASGAAPGPRVVPGSGAGGTGGTAEPGAAPTIVYADALQNGYTDLSWATHALAQAAVVHSGTQAISMETGAYKGLMFAPPSPWASGRYGALDFWVHGSGAGGQQLVVTVYFDDRTVGTTVQLEKLVPGSKVSGSAWQHATVPLASLASRPGNVAAIVLQSASATDQGPVYIDDIALVAAGAAAAGGSTTGTTGGTGGTVSGSTGSTGGSGGSGTSGGTAGAASPGGGGGTTGGAVATAPVAWANIVFGDNPGGNDPNAVALSFDDGPDGSGGTGQNNTGYVLDQLKKLGVHATFFTCGNLATNVLTDTVAQADMRRIINEGHDLGNHTYDHKSLEQITAQQVDDELAMNLAVVQNANVLGPSATMSMYRAPFGQPFQVDDPNVAAVGAITHKYGVHIGWGIDSDDWKCAQNNQPVDCVVNNVKFQLNQGRSGVILMHALYKLTGDALPAVVQAIHDRGYHIVMVQDFIRAKYGVSSDALMKANRGASFTSSQLGQAAQNACLKNDFDIDPPY